MPAKGVSRVGGPGTAVVLSGAVATAAVLTSCGTSNSAAPSKSPAASASPVAFRARHGPTPAPPRRLRLPDRRRLSPPAETPTSSRRRSTTGSCRCRRTAGTRSPSPGPNVDGLRQRLGPLPGRRGVRAVDELARTGRALGHPGGRAAAEHGHRGPAGVAGAQCPDGRARRLHRHPALDPCAARARRVSADLAGAGRGDRLGTARPGLTREGAPFVCRQGRRGPADPQATSPFRETRCPHCPALSPFPRSPPRPPRPRAAPHAVAPAKSGPPPGRSSLRPSW